MGILMLGAGLQSSLLGLRATLEGFPAAVTGLVMSCYYVGVLMGTIAAPRLVHSVGHVRVFAALAAVASAVSLAQPLWVHPVPWGAMRLVTGFCLSGIYVVAESWLNDRASRANRGQLLAVYMVVTYVGMGCAQLLLNLASPREPVLFMVISMLTSLAIVPIVLSARQVPQVAAAPRVISPLELYRSSPLGVVGVMVSGFVSSIQLSMGPVYAHLSGLGTAGVSGYMAATILAGMASQYPVGRLSDRTDRRTMIAAMCGLATAVAACIVFLGGLLQPLLLTFAALFAACALTLYSLSSSHVNDKLEPGDMVAASSVLLLMNGCGAALGPFLAGSLIGAFGPRAYFAILGTMTGALTIYDLWRKMRRRPPQTRRPFVTTQPS
jgi:MFS family permease